MVRFCSHEHLTLERHRYPVLIFMTIEFGNLRTVIFLKQWGRSCDFEQPLAILRCRDTIIDYLRSLKGLDSSDQEDVDDDSYHEPYDLQGMYIVCERWDKFRPGVELDKEDYALWEYPRVISMESCRRLLTCYRKKSLNYYQVLAVCCKRGYWDLIPEDVEATRWMIYATSRVNMSYLSAYDVDDREKIREDYYDGYPERMYHNDPEAVLLKLPGAIEFEDSVKLGYVYKRMEIDPYTEVIFRNMTGYERMDLTMQVYMWSILRRGLLSVNFAFQKKKSKAVQGAPTSRRQTIAPHLPYTLTWFILQQRASLAPGLRTGYVLLRLPPKDSWDLVSETAFITSRRFN